MPSCLFGYGAQWRVVSVILLTVVRPANHGVGIVGQKRKNGILELLWKMCHGVSNCIPFLHAHIALSSPWVGNGIGTWCVSLKSSIRTVGRIDGRSKTRPFTKGNGYDSFLGTFSINEENLETSTHMYILMVAVFR